MSIFELPILVKKTKWLRDYFFFLLLIENASIVVHKSVTLAL